MSSHLPHVVAATLANLVLDPAWPQQQTDLCANGFRDTTRVASGSPEMWRDIAGLRDEEVTALIRQDKIDILVDLTMHMAGSHLLVFARKPAPVQITYLGYPNTTESAEGLPLTFPRSNRMGSYIHDDWKVSPRLTVNVGLRFDYVGARKQ